VNIARQSTMFQLGIQRFARTGPIRVLRLQAQERILNLFMLGFDRKRALRELERRIGISGIKLLLHQPTHTDEPCGIVLPKTLWVRGYPLSFITLMRIEQKL